MSEIFISYRYDDTNAMAHRIHDHLTQELRSNTRPNPVFLDTHDVAAGAELKPDILKVLNKAHVLLVMIGKNWLSLTGASSDNPRLFDPGDFLRKEIEYGLKERIAGDIEIIPVLVHSARMPRTDELPSDIRTLAGFRGISIREEETAFREDMAHLTKEIRNYLREAHHKRLQEAIDYLYGYDNASLLDAGAEFNEVQTLLSRPEQTPYEPSRITLLAMFAGILLVLTVFGIFLYGAQSGL